METAPQAASRYVVYFTKGLADVVTGQIGELAPGAAVSEPADRYVIVSAEPAELARLRSDGRTFDDLRLLVAGPSAVPDAASFGHLCAQAAVATRAQLAAIDPARADSTAWSVTLSARAPSWRRPPGWDPADLITARLGADPRARSRAEVDLRIQVDGEQAHISVSLSARPRGKREPAPARPGALRPSVAAALVRLAVRAADPAAAARGLYDPCCGTGTIPAEAARLSLPVSASDIDAEAVAITSQRLAAVARPRRAGPPPVRVFQHDLRRGIPRDLAAGIAASNLPWGKQARLPRRSELFDAVAALTAVMLAEGGASALLTTHEQQLAGRIRRRAPQARITTRRIGLLGQTPAIVVASRDGGG
jgi:predicted RNA methylase